MRILSTALGLLLTVPSVCAQEEEIARVFNEADVMQYHLAAAAYLEWLATAAEPDDDWEALALHLRWIGLVMSSDEPAFDSVKRLLAGNGAQADAQGVVSWWHRQDPLPATLNNERVEEHLYRVYHARRTYAYARDSLGVDDRGRIFVRLGRPWRDSAIKLRSAGLRMVPFEVTLPQNELWVYRGLHDDAHYLFVRRSRRQPYVISTSEALIPRSLRSSRRQVNLLLTWMEEVFGQLALEHPHYGITYDVVTNHTTLPTTDAQTPFLFTQKVLEEARTRDDFHARSRERTVPRSVMDVHRNRGQLEPSVRWARFLEPSGQTRLEVYWWLSPAQFRPRNQLVRQLTRRGAIESDDFLLTATLTRRTSAFAPERVRIRRFHLPNAQTHLPAQTWEAPGLEGLAPFALQWSLHWTMDDPGRSGPAPGPTLALGSLALDSVQALPSDAESLVMSDLKPLALPASGSFTRARPFAQRTLSEDSRLGLYFELYFLATDDQDRTHYSVEYQISGERAPPIAAITEYEGTTSTAREHIALDLSAWTTPGPVTITVSAVDLVRNLSVSREIAYEYVPGRDS